MSGTETVILDKTTVMKGRARTLGQKISLAEKIMLKLSERQLAKDVESDFFFFLTDFLEALKTENFLSLAPDPERGTRPIAKLVQDNAKTVSKEDFLEEVKTFLSTRKVSWLDTDVMIFEWSDLHSMSQEDVISKLQGAPISQAHIGMELDDQGTNYLSYIITG